MTQRDGWVILGLVVALAVIIWRVTLLRAMMLGLLAGTALALIR